MGRETLTLVEDRGEETGQRTLLFSRLAEDDYWQWLEPGGQANVLHRLAAALDEVLRSRGVFKTDATTGRVEPTCDKYESLRHEGILVVSKSTGATDDDGNTGADVLMAVALDFIAAARRFQLPGGGVPQLQMGLDHGEFRMGFRSKKDGSAPSAQILFGGPVFAAVRLLAAASDGNSVLVSERVKEVLRPDHVARLCPASCVTVRGAPDIQTYRPLSEDEILDRKAQTAASRLADSHVTPMVGRDQQDWLLRFQDPLLEHQYWLWGTQYKPRSSDTSVYWIVVVLGTAITLLYCKQSVYAPGAHPTGLSPVVAMSLPLAHDALLVWVMLLIAISPPTYNRHRQPLSFAVRLVRTLLLVVLHQVPTQHALLISPINSGWLQDLYTALLLFARGVCVGPLIYIATHQLRMVPWHLLGEGLTFILVAVSATDVFGLGLASGIWTAPFFAVQIAAGVLVPTYFLWQLEKELRTQFMASYRSKLGRTMQYRSQ